uniref:Transmembrane protein 175 n=1 Tax=Noctiluca scintillans TaxID=2966 RepID=A0A7S1A0V4_NOCSC
MTSFYNAFGRQFFELLIPFFFPLVQCFELVKSHGYNQLNIFMAMRMKLTRKSVTDAVEFPLMTVYDDYVNAIVFIMLILTIVMVHSESNPHLIFVFTGILVCFHVYRAVFWAWRSTPQHLNGSWHFRCVLLLWSALPLSVLGMVMVQWGWICFFGGVSRYLLPGSAKEPSPIIVQCVAFLCCSVVNLGFFYLALASSRMWDDVEPTKKDAEADFDPASFFNTNLPLVIMTRCVVVNDAKLLDRLPRHVREEIESERKKTSTASEKDKAEFASHLMHPYVRGKEYQQKQMFSFYQRQSFSRRPGHLEESEA